MRPLVPKGSHVRIEAALSQPWQKQRKVAFGPAYSKCRVKTQDSCQLAASLYIAADVRVDPTPRRVKARRAAGE